MNPFSLQKIGVFGGTFNPIHWGHLLIAEMALSQFKLQQILWVPTYRPPHKTHHVLEFKHRMAMVQRAIADHPAFVASDVEVERESVSYAIATLTDLKGLFPSTDWYWIIGMDAFKSLPQWQNSAAVAEQCTWLIAPRSSETIQQCQQVAAQLLANSVQLRWSVLQMPHVEVSSSLIREYCYKGRSLRYLIPEAVRDYIIAHQLYRESEAPQKSG